ALRDEHRPIFASTDTVSWVSLQPRQQGYISLSQLCHHAFRHFWVKPLPHFPKQWEDMGAAQVFAGYPGGTGHWVFHVFYACVELHLSIVPMIIGIKTYTPCLFTLHNAHKAVLSLPDTSRHLALPNGVFMGSRTSIE